MNAPDPAQLAALQQQVAALAAENQQLRAHLEQLHARQQAVGKVVWGGARMLVPLLDRNKVVRSFGQLVQTTSEFVGPREQWPARDRLIADARTFAESCVRFAVRRRTLVLLFSLLATAIPAIQIWLVVQQNEIIENQNEFFEIQVYDIVARSMTEPDRNTKLMTGALLSRSDPAFLGGVIDEAFDPDLGAVYREEGLEADTRRLWDAAFRAPLVRAVVRSVEHRAAEVDADELYAEFRPMFRLVLDDAQSRVPSVLRIGTEPVSNDEAAEQVDDYLVQIGEAMRMYWRLSGAAGEREAFFEDAGDYLRRVAAVKLADNRFRDGYRYGLEDLIFEAAVDPELDAPPVDLADAGLEPESAYDKGIAALRAGIGSDRVDWDALRAQVTAP